MKEKRFVSSCLIGCAHSEESVGTWKRKSQVAAVSSMSQGALRGIEELVTFTDN